MANETNYSLKEIGFIKEDIPGVIDKTPALYKLGVIGMSLAPTQKTEQNTELGVDGQATAMDTGSKDFAGNINIKLKTNLMPILLHSVAGKSTKVDATADAWTAATTYTGPVNKYESGQIVNHSDGVHTLVVKSVLGTGTSGATEPDLSGLAEYATIVDNPGANQITWIVRDKMFKHTGATDQDMQSVGVYCKNSTAQGGGLDFEQYFAGGFCNSFQMSKTNGTVVYKYDMPMVAMNYSDDQQDDWEAIVPTSEVEIKDRSFSFDDMKVEIGGACPEKATEFTLTLNRNVTVEDQICQGEKDYNVPVLAMDGTLKVKFTKEQWKQAYENTNKGIVVTYANRTGDSVKLTFPVTKLLLGTMENSTDMFNYVTIPLSPSGTATQKTMTYETITTSDW